ncbi:hypothetical protein HBB16_05620 [Pseudonocardia sp. MCCB 268]|nr:hypothetical protein [Pseudonocardia cytotoxica]
MLLALVVGGPLAGVGVASRRARSPPRPDRRRRPPRPMRGRHRTPTLGSPACRQAPGDRPRRQRDVTGVRLEQLRLRASTTPCSWSDGCRRGAGGANGTDPGRWVRSRADLSFGASTPICPADDRRRRGRPSARAGAVGLARRRWSAPLRSKRCARGQPSSPTSS